MRFLLAVGAGQATAEIADQIGWNNTTLGLVLNFAVSLTALWAHSMYRKNK